MLDLILMLHQCAPTVAPETMRAVVTHESARNPYAIGINSRAWKLVRQPRNEAEAVATAQELIDRGVSVDMGWAQINSQHLRKMNLSVKDIFEPCTNLRVGGYILTDCYQRASSYSGNQRLHAALSCYNTGTFTAGLQNGYVAKVYRAAKN